MDFRKHSVTSNLIRVVLKHATTGVGLTGLTEASAGLIIGTIADVEATTTRYRASSSEIEAITTLGTYAAPTSGKCRFKEVDATNHKGLYEIQVADARFSVASARRLVISWTGATNLLDGDYEIRLVQFDPQDSVRLGLTALPNAAAEAAGGLYTRGSGAGQINQQANGQIDSNLERWINTAPLALSSQRVQVLVGAITNGVIVAATFAANALDAVWATATRILTAGTNIALAKGVGLTGLNDLSAAQVNTEADTALSDVGLTATVTGRIDAAISTRTKPADTQAAVTLVTTTTNLTTNNDKTGYGLSAAAVQAIWDAATSALTAAGSIGKKLADWTILTSTTTADAVWNAVAASYNAALSMGNKLNAAGSAGDPWSTVVPGAYGAGTAGKILGDNLNATVSSVKAKTDLIPAAPAAVGDVPTALQNADALLARDIGSGTGAGALNERTVRAALRFNRNKFVIAGGTLTVYREDDTTVAFTAAITQTAGNPVSASDPV